MGLHRELARSLCPEPSDMVGRKAHGMLGGPAGGGLHDGCLQAYETMLVIFA